MWADHRVARSLSNRGGHGQARVLGSAVERSESDPSEGVDPPPDVGVDVDERMANERQGQQQHVFLSFISGAVFCTGWESAARYERMRRKASALGTG